MPDSPTPARSRLPLLALLLANVMLACGPWLVRLARADDGVGPVAAGFWRLALALPVLLAVAAARRRPSAAGWRPAAVVAAGGIAFALDLAFWHVGILHTRLGNATLFGNSTAIVYPLYGFLVARAWPRPRQMAALLLAALGAALLMGRSYELSAHNMVGDLLCILAGLFYTVYLIAVGAAGARLGKPATLALSVTVGLPILLATAFALGEQVWPHGWAALVLLAIGSQLVGQGLVIYAIDRLPPLVVGVMLLVQPVVSAAIGWRIYGERLGPADLMGAAAVFVAMLLVRAEPASGALRARRRALSSAG